VAMEGFLMFRYVGFDGCVIHWTHYIKILLNFYLRKDKKIIPYIYDEAGGRYKN
jgi:hypothetical protein